MLRYPNAYNTSYSKAYGEAFIKGFDNYLYSEPIPPKSSHDTNFLTIYTNTVLLSKPVTPNGIFPVNTSKAFIFYYGYFSSSSSLLGVS